MIYIIAGLILFIIYQDIAHYIERKDLYNRIMANSLSELKVHKQKPMKNFIKSKLEKE